MTVPLGDLYDYTHNDRACKNLDSYLGMNIPSARPVHHPKTKSIQLPRLPKIGRVSIDTPQRPPVPSKSPHRLRRSMSGFSQSSAEEEMNDNHTKMALQKSLRLAKRLLHQRIDDVGSAGGLDKKQKVVQMQGAVKPIWNDSQDHLYPQVTTHIQQTSVEVTPPRSVSMDQPPRLLSYDPTRRPKLAPHTRSSRSEGSHSPPTRPPRALRSVTAPTTATAERPCSPPACTDQGQRALRMAAEAASVSGIRPSVQYLPAIISRSNSTTSSGNQRAFTREGGSCRQSIETPPVSFNINTSTRTSLIPPVKPAPIKPLPLVPTWTERKKKTTTNVNHQTSPKLGRAYWTRI